MDAQAYLNACLTKMLELKGQDLFLKVGARPRARVGGVVISLAFDPFKETDAESIARSVLNQSQIGLLERNRSVDFGFSLNDSKQRFRGNVFRQQSHYSFVIRRLWQSIPSFEALRIPPILKKVAMERSGIILLAGTVASGKTTTIHAMVDLMNQKAERHIITIEDPVEYLHEDQKCIINQREIGQDANDFSSALKYVVRQSPDAVVIGEMRDAETFNFALSASEVGRLVISTVHAKSAVQIFDRLLSFFPVEQRNTVLNHLCFHITCFVVQKLLVTKDGSTLVPAFEILIGNPLIRQLVRERNFDKIPQAIQNGKMEGMQTMDQSLKLLWEEGMISKEEALAASEHPIELEKAMKGIQLHSQGSKILGA